MMKKEVEEKLSKLEQLMRLPTDTVLDFYDLSNDSISEFPNLSTYTIRSIDLSHNQIDTLPVDYLPQGIVKINLSHNKLKPIFNFNLNHDLSLDSLYALYKKATIKELNISHNKLRTVDISFNLRKLILSHNNVTYLNLFQGNLEYIDISNNPNLSNVVYFDPDKVDTILRENISNKKKLVLSGRMWHIVD